MTNAAAQPTAPTTGGGYTASAAAGVDLMQLQSTLQALVQALQALVEMLQGQVAGGGAVAGGGGIVQQGGGTQLYSADPMQGHDMSAHGAHLLPNPPARNDPRFLKGTTGPTVKDGKAPTIKIPDGEGFHGAKGRKQNADDKKKNNYSVTDANFSNQLGLLPRNPDNGKEMTYVQHIQTYAAANYLEAYAPQVYQKLVTAQNEGRGTILGGAAHIMGLVKTSDPSESGLSAADLQTVPSKIPGTPMDAKQYIASGKDITGQDWARMHHAGSQFRVMSGLINAGLDWKDAMILSGDDGISGSGRLNGVNNQDNKGGMNKGEREIWSYGAQLQQRTGIPIIQIMMGGHNHLGGDESALTNPKINKIIGFDKKDRSASPERAAAIYQTLLNGKVGDSKLAHAKGTKADNKHLLKYAKGGLQPREATYFSTPTNMATTTPQVQTSTSMPMTTTKTS